MISAHFAAQGIASMTRRGLFLAGLVLLLATPPAHAATVTFDSAQIGVNPFGSPNSTYSEAGFDITGTPDSIISNIFPGSFRAFVYPNIPNSIVSSTISVVQSGFGDFQFQSLEGFFQGVVSDQLTPPTIVVEGFLNNSSVGIDTFSPTTTVTSQTFLASVLAGKALDFMLITMNSSNSSQWAAVDSITFGDAGSPIPEPGSLLLAGLGLAGLLLLQRRRSA